MLQPFIQTMATPPEINKKTLLRWLTHMQGSEIELGGFRGRTNKLVDGCYAWWVGGVFGLLGAIEPAARNSEHAQEIHQEENEEHDDKWVDDDDSLFNRQALQEYILWAAQHPSGGLRDKPPKSADAYHTLYCLSGLSSAQHRIVPSSARRKQLDDAWDTNSNPAIPNDIRKDLFLSSLCWDEDESAALYVGGKENRLNATHPVFGLTITHTEGIMGYFYKQKIPPRTSNRPSTS
jgi:protein farnesyltransferase subunit beta